jgi:hypothetical protein
MVGITKTTANNRSKLGGQVKTLDTEHTIRMQRFQGMHAEVQALTDALAAKREAIGLLEARGRTNLSDAELEELLSLHDDVRQLVQQKDALASHRAEIDYFTDTASILYKYYDILENGVPTVSASDSSSRVEHPGLQPLPQGLRRAGGGGASAPAGDSILKWFQSPQQPTTTPENSSPSSGGCSSAKPREKPQKHFDRATLLDKYLCFTDSTHIRSSALHASGVETTACPHCKSQSRTAMMHDGYIFCNACYTIEYILVDHDKPSYKDPPKEITYFAYKRINHFNEWLNTVQGKETTLIPDEMFDKILLELKKLRITNLSELTNAKMKEILKKLRPEGGSRYYEHIPHIITKLNGLPTPHFPPELEERLRHMFCQIQVPFLKHACALTPTRKNFLSYAYCLNKMVQLLEKDQYLASFPLLKSREKLHQQDLIWKKICEDLGWQYYRSI